MRRNVLVLILSILLIFLTACATYKRKPLPFKAPSAYDNATEVVGALVGAEAFVDRRTTKEAFGFDIRGAGMLPVQVVFDNQGPHPLKIDVAQTFLEDAEGNLWPILDREIAYERATKYSQTKKIFKEGAYGGFLGATAGALIGAAVGIVTGENVAEAAGKGAAVGAAAGPDNTVTAGDFFTISGVTTPPLDCIISKVPVKFISSNFAVRLPR